MRAIVFDPPAQGDNGPLLREAPVPAPGRGEALVRVRRAGLNYADLMMRQGVYPHPKGYPLVAGLELAGEIVALGPGATGWSEGERVAAFSEDAGGFADFCAVPTARLIRLPDAMDFDVGAAFPIQSLTAWHLLHTVSRTAPGDRLLIHAIGGGVGLQLTQLAKIAGATVIGTVGTPGKEALPRKLGADLVLNRAESDFVAETLAATDGRGVDKVLDSTGASILDRSFECIRPLGHVVSYGEAEGKPYSNLWERLVRRSLTFTRMHLGHLDNHADYWIEGVAQVTAAVLSGALTVPIAGRYAMADAAAMFEALDSRRTAGKLILTVAD